MRTQFRGARRLKEIPNMVTIPQVRFHQRDVERNEKNSENIKASTKIFYKINVEHQNFLQN